MELSPQDIAALSDAIAKPVANSLEIALHSHREEVQRVLATHATANNERMDGMDKRLRTVEVETGSLQEWKWRAAAIIGGTATIIATVAGAATGAVWAWLRKKMGMGD